MSNTLSHLQPTAIWQHFSQLNAIPRASKKEERVIQFMKGFGENLGLETIVDQTGNVLIKKPATAGMEAKPTIILQAHLDMVHQKNAATEFDFATQGIEMYVDGDWVRAKGTTLGADNGIGVAAIMSVLAANKLVHPAIEAIFTIDEEVGMTGAMDLQKGFLTGDILLNLDSEEDHILTVGSAGGVDVVIQGEYKLKELKANYTFFQLTLKGLTGGHSGVDIHKGGSNAIKLLSRVLFEVNKKCAIRIAAIVGGDMTSAIPRECTATIALELRAIPTFQDQIKQWSTLLQKENKDSDPGLMIEIGQVKKAIPVLSKRMQGKLLSSLYTCPYGIYRMTPSLNNLVQSSNNIGKILVENGTYHIGCFARSFIESERRDVVNVIRNCFAPMKANITENNPFPGWQPRPNTKTVTTMKQVYTSLFGQAPEIYAIHAGLECGVLSETYPHLEIVSFGPNIKGAHSPEEALQISSTQKFWQYLISVLKEL